MPYPRPPTRQPIPQKTDLIQNDRPKRVWRRVDGVLLLDKPKGVTSNTALQMARRLFSAAKAGHTGTLDPMATGLLPLCFGEATKFSADLLEADKTYEADVCFGITTDTGDAEGQVLERCPARIERHQLDSVMPQFRGTIRQVPPMYSALKRDGQPLYRLARQGIEVEREAREVTISELLVLDSGADHCRLRVTCSKGTYIRTLAEDIGRALRCGAHLTALRRVVVGDLTLASAVSLETLNALSEDARLRYLLPPDALLQSLPVASLESVAAARFSHGNPVDMPGLPAGKCRVYHLGQLLGVAVSDGAGRLQPSRLVASA